ncbi:hypothetical protein [Oryzisolibacter sp. LB2S]|uniref:hypothetical protein n=1 Tax=Alicycliphilus soli TaxID=3228789 RepID=UPI003458B4C7
MQGNNVGEWRLYSGGFFMRTKEGEGGELARLADVRDWLMHRYAWPMDRAADEIIGKLCYANRSGLTLFIADKKRYATRLRPDQSMLSPQALMERGGLRDLDPRLLGFEGVCNAILNGWIGEYRGYTEVSARVDAVCVLVAVAAELWGWGTVAEAGGLSPFNLADWPALVAYRKANRGSGWGRGNQIDILEAELRRRTDAGQNKSDALDAMAKELGYAGRRALENVLSRTKAGRKRDQKAAPAFAVTKVRDGRKIA